MFTSITGTGIFVSVCPSAARGSTLSCPCPCKHLTGNTHQSAVVISPIIDVFNKFQLCIFFTYQANFLMKRTFTLPGFFPLGFIVLPSDAFLPFPRCQKLTPGPQPREHFACLNHCLSRTFLTSSPNQLGALESANSPPHTHLALLTIILGSRTDR